MIVLLNGGRGRGTDFAAAAGVSSVSSSIHAIALTLKRKYRLSDRGQFQRVRREGQSWANRVAVLCAQRNSLGYNRYGFSVSRRIGKAVVRNRIKRLLSEAVRLRHDAIDSGWDLVFIARGPIQRATFQTVDNAIEQLLRQASLLKEKEHEKVDTDPD